MATLEQLLTTIAHIKALTNAQALAMLGSAESTIRTAQANAGDSNLLFETLPGEAERADCLQRILDLEALASAGAPAVNFRADLVEYLKQQLAAAPRLLDATMAGNANREKVRGQLFDDLLENAAQIGGEVAKLAAFGIGAGLLLPIGGAIALVLLSSYLD